MREQNIKAQVWLVVASIAFSGSYLFVYSNSKENFYLAEKEYSQKEIKRAIRFYNKSLRWYIPFNPYSKGALQRLTQLAKSNYLKGNWDRAFELYQECYSSIISIRSAFQPHLREYLEILSAITGQLSELPPPDSREYDQKKYKRELQKLYQKRENKNWKGLIVILILIISVFYKDLIQINKKILFGRFRYIFRGLGKNKERAGLS